MGLYEFLTAHREQIEQACRSELQAPEELGRLRQCWLSFFAELASKLEPAAKPTLAQPRFTLIGSSSALVRLRASIDQLSRRSRAPVLILGEPGSGRRHCARVLHEATYPDGELFLLGRVEQLEELERRVAALSIRSSASSIAGLTVYTHELADAPPRLQLALCKLLNEQSLPLRVVASSRRPLGPACREGLVRSDLVFGFSSVLELPPLRERVADIPELSRHFAELIASRSDSGSTLLSQAALRRLQEYTWPGNLSELRQLMERLAQQLGPGLAELADLPELGERSSGVFFVLPPSGIEFAELERTVLMQALAMAQNNQTRAASLLGLTRDQIRYRLAKFEIAGDGRQSG